jgi:hypothetical protein
MVYGSSAPADANSSTPATSLTISTIFEKTAEKNRPGSLSHNMKTNTMVFKDAIMATAM